MRSALVISAIAAAFAGLALIAALVFTDWLRFGPRQASEISPEGTEAIPQMTPAERKAAILIGIETMGYDEEAHGVRVVATEQGAAFLSPGERRIEVAPPAGWRLSGEFVVLHEIFGGFFLVPEATGDGGEVEPEARYVSFIDARQPLEPRTSQEAIRRYSEAAERIRGEGTMPYLDGRADVVSVTPAQDAVFYCFRVPSGMLFQGGTRFVGPLSVTAVRAGACPEDRAEITRHLNLGEAALAFNR
ncbi:MAG: hypothetical protein ACFBRM_13610 [Pikeienuella sp.]